MINWPQEGRGAMSGKFELGGQRYWVLSVGIAEEPGKTLSPAERLTALYVSRGLSNAEVARRRGVALRTVANQVASILRKTRVSSRAEIGRVLSQPKRETATR
jgi:DNA-binding CsgD family transcriptional regulator